MAISIEQSGRVDAARTFVLPVSARQAWGQMRDIAGFIAIDPLHTNVLMENSAGESPRGCGLIIPHRLLGVGPDRVGRVLKWEEGRGFAFSDLSKRGVQRGFPHVCAYEVEDAEGGCRMTVSARGRWTARCVPRWMVRVWLWWVLSATEAHVRAHFRGYGEWLAGRK